MAESELLDTQLKLRDAESQMELALQNVRDEDLFRSCINGFIAAARSVTMIMEKESANHSKELLAWFKEQTAKLAADPVARFFSSQRTYTMHRGVVRPAATHVEVLDYTVSEAPDKQEGTKKQITFKIPKEGSAPPPVRIGDVMHTMPGGESAIAWTFPEAAEHLPGRSTNVFRLCEEYFVTLKTLVHAWLRRREELDAERAG